LVSVLVVVVPPGVVIVSVLPVFDSWLQPTRPTAGNKKRPRIRADDRVRFMSFSLLKQEILESLVSGQPHDELAHPNENQTADPHLLAKISEIANRARAGYLGPPSQKRCDHHGQTGSNSPYRRPRSTSISTITSTNPRPPLGA
jgi:hypothetical protein